MTQEMVVIKSELTKQLEKDIWKFTGCSKGIGTFGCFEVTIGWSGKERVDFMTYSTKGDFRCYEIKISKSDFYSKAFNTFVGDFNYYVMPDELYEIVKKDIPAHIGVINGKECIKKPKRQKPLVSHDILKNSMIRSLYREVHKHYQSVDMTKLNKLKNEVSRYKRESDKYRKEFNILKREYTQLKRGIKSNGK